MTHDTIIMSVIPHENGLSFIWVEPVVIRGELMPGEKKPPVKDETPPSPPVFEAESEAAARREHEKVASPIAGILDSMHKATLEANDQIVYRMVKRTVVVKDGDDQSVPLRALAGAQRVLNDLNRRGAFAEAQVGSGPPNMPMLMAGLPMRVSAEGGEASRKGKRTPRRPRKPKPKK